jgi:tRNA modification GTPase
VLEIHLDLGGYPVTVLDTAGIRDTNDPVEREGVRRAGEQAAGADLVLWVIEPTSESAGKAPVEAGWLVVNKMDLADPARRIRTEFIFKNSNRVHFISSTTGMGVEQLVTSISGFAARFFTQEAALVTRERQRAHLRETVLALGGARQAAKDGREEIMAEQLRLATRALGRLLGRVDVEDVLDVIFRDFCIGK